jgi:hypothetical protein
MAFEAPTAILVVGTFATVVGAGVALVNSWKTVCWKRAELANSYMKDFNENEELVFAGQCLDWEGGVLALPENLRAYMPDNARIIQHDKRVFQRALSPALQLNEMADDPRVQIYRSMDSFLSWLNLVASALDRKLFLVADIQDVGYWVAKIESEPVVMAFIMAYGYGENFEKLTLLYRSLKSPYKDWHFFPNTMLGRLMSDMHLDAIKTALAKRNKDKSTGSGDQD